MGGNQNQKVKRFIPKISNFLRRLRGVKLSMVDHLETDTNCLLCDGGSESSQFTICFRIGDIQNGLSSKE